MAKQKRKDAGVTEKKSKKLKTSAREMPPAPAAPVATDEVQGAVSPEEQRVLDRKLKKERKKEARRLLREAGIPAAQSPPARPSGAELALDYLCGWAQKREDWRFQKTRQTWLLVHMYDRDQVGVLGRGHPQGSGRPVVGWAGPIRHSGLGARPLCAWPPSWARPHSSFLGPFLSRPSPGSDYKEAVAVAPGHPYGDEARAQEEPTWGGVGTLLGLPGGRTLNPGGCGCGSTAGSPGGPAGCGAEAEAGGRSPQALPRASPTRRPQPGLHTTWPPPAPTLGDVLVAGGPVENHTRPASALPPPPQHPLVRIVARPLTLVALPAPRGQLSGQRAGLGLSTPGWGHL
uniref:WKF domain-containing protein n=1 Tax=Sus scrofa TaxID=9823 RepID=A0A8D1LKM7_PIG